MKSPSQDSLIMYSGKMTWLAWIGISNLHSKCLSMSAIIASPTQQIETAPGIFWNPDLCCTLQIDPSAAIISDSKKNILPVVVT
jgi:hypothetical protein